VSQFTEVRLTSALCPYPKVSLRDTVNIYPLGLPSALKRFTLHLINLRTAILFIKSLFIKQIITAKI
ncbi:MAG: hypothetical protein AAFR77_17550, partial [Cyanobacteria bacterium J06631_2]